MPANYLEIVRGDNGIGRGAEDAGARSAYPPKLSVNADILDKAAQCQTILLHRPYVGFVGYLVVSMNALLHVPGKAVLRCTLCFRDGSNNEPAYAGARCARRPEQAAVDACEQVSRVR